MVFILPCAMVPRLNLDDGWNDTKFHAELVKKYTEMIPFVAKAGYKNLICFSGARRGWMMKPAGRIVPKD